MSLLTLTGELETKDIHQILSIAGDGNILNEATSNEFRKYLELVKTDQLQKYLNECLHPLKTASKKDSNIDGFILQDIVNEIGKRLGFNVERGLYKGKKGENGFDGLWTSDNCSIIIESKKTDAYSLSIETLEKYRKTVIKEQSLDPNRCSILVVVGLSKKGGFIDLVKGSVFVNDIRIISMDSLSTLLTIKEGLNDVIVDEQIKEILKPHEYIRVDELINLIFYKKAVNKVHVTVDPSIPNLFDPNLKVPQLPNTQLKVGKFIKQAMLNLSKSSYKFTQTQIENLCDKEWSHKVLGLGYSFFRKYNPTDTNNLCDANGYKRYYPDIFQFGTQKVFITHELYERNRDPFINWYNQLK